MKIKRIVYFKDCFLEITARGKIVAWSRDGKIWSKEKSVCKYND
jgi:hypothetical protein